MTANQTRAKEKARLDSIEALDLDAARGAFNRIALLARSLAGVRSAYVDLVLADQLWITGVSERPTPVVLREHSFANHVIADDGVLWVEDLAVDERFRDNPFVTGDARCRFYAGAPIHLSNGARIGALSIIDGEPRPFDPVLAERLHDFAALAADEWERRRALSEWARTKGQTRALSRQMAALVEAAPVALVMTDRDLRILLVSPRWRRDMGMENVDVIGRRIFDLFPHAEERRGEGFRRALAGETIIHERLKFFLPNGEEPWVRAEATPWRDADGAIGGLLLMTHDITDMVVSLERAERSERRLRLATELSDLAVWEMDYRDQRLETGGAMSDDMREGMTYAAMTNIWGAVHPADRAESIAMWDRHVETGEPYRAVHRLMQRDGPHIWVSVAAEAIRGAEGDIDRVIGVIRNIDREKRAEAAMAKALAAAEAASRAKNEFLANMSHEIRTPLNGVMGVASVLGRADLSPEHREMVEIIESSAKTLEVLLSDVLDLARIEAGRLTLVDEPFDLAKALHVVAALFEPRALEKGLSFKSTILPAARATVRGDVTRLRQVVSNLLSNAVKFTDQGRVSLNVEAEQLDETVRLRLSVLDTGIGFDAETGQRLFQRFEQADGSITRRFGGTGLGLSISRSLAEAMGGTLSATSVPGKGSAFTLELELPRSAEILTPEPAPLPIIALPAAETCGDTEDPAPRAAPRILLAEDHPTNRKVVSLILESAGVDLHCVEDGVEALAAFDAERFDLILMDMQMPRMDGLTAIRSIRARERRSGSARTPILLLTANAMPEHASASVTAGADGHLTKPISANELIAAVAAACEGGAAESGAGAEVA